MAVKLNEYVVSNGILDDASELRERMDREGYLFFRELIDPGIELGSAQRRTGGAATSRMAQRGRTLDRRLSQRRACVRGAGA